MAVVLLLTGSSYFYLVAGSDSGAGQLAQPMLPQVAIYTLAVVVLSIGGQTLIALLAPKEANLPLDERERQIVDRAARYSSYVLATGIVLSLGLYIVLHDGDLLFYSAFGSLLLSQVAEYGVQILLYRRSV
jgi:hypothetical protein